MIVAPIPNLWSRSERISWYPVHKAETCRAPSAWRSAPA